MGLKLGLKLNDFAKANKLGIGSFRLKDGSSVKLLSNGHLTHAIQVKDGEAICAKGAGGNRAIAALLDEYVPLAQDPDSVFDAFAHSLNLVG